MARCADWWCATRDARRGLPDLPADQRESTDHPDIPTGTPHMTFLGQQGIGRIEKEWIVYEAEVADPLADYRDLQAQVRALKAELSTAEERSGTLEQSSGGTDAAPGESATDPGIIAQRRAREHGRKRDEAQSTVRRLTSDISRAEARAAQVKEQIDIRLRIAQRRAAMIEAHIRRRRASYETRLVRKHPQGLLLNRLLRPGWPTAPEWAATAALVTETREVLQPAGEVR